MNSTLLRHAAIRGLCPLFLSLFFGALLGCGDDEEAPQGVANLECSCTITYNGVTETVACGQHACVNGMSYECTTEGLPLSGKSCSAADALRPASGAAGSSAGQDSTSSAGQDSTSSAGQDSTGSEDPDSGSTAGEQKTNHCTDVLAAYCATCTSEVARRSCEATVADGDEARCVSWQANSSRLCRP